MTCIHGLDENNCPTCRLSKSIIPLNSISKLGYNKNDLKARNPLFEKNTSLKENFYKDLKNKNYNKPNFLRQIPKLTKFGEIPNYSNYLFDERLRMSKFHENGPKPKIEIDKHEIEWD